MRTATMWGRAVQGESAWSWAMLWNSSVSSVTASLWFLGPLCYKLFLVTCSWKHFLYTCCLQLFLKNPPRINSQNRNSKIDSFLTFKKLKGADILSLLVLWQPARGGRWKRSQAVGLGGREGPSACAAGVSVVPACSWHVVLAHFWSPVLHLRVSSLWYPVSLSHESFLCFSHPQRMLLAVDNPDWC